MGPAQLRQPPPATSFRTPDKRHHLALTKIKRREAHTTSRHLTAAYLQVDRLQRSSCTLTSSPQGYSTQKVGQGAAGLE